MYYPSVVPVFGASDGKMETAWSELPSNDCITYWYNFVKYSGLMDSIFNV